MSVAMSGPLQLAVFAALEAHAPLAALVGTHIYDAVPSGDLPPLYVRLGGESVRDASDVSGGGAVHQLTLSVMTTHPGFAAAKAVAGAVCDALQDADLVLTRGRLVSLRFQRATARRRDAETSRRIDLIFRARVQDD